MVVVVNAYENTKPDNNNAKAGSRPHCCMSTMLDEHPTVFDSRQVRRILVYIYGLLNTRVY